MKTKYTFIILLASALAFTGCNKWLEVPPENVILDIDALETPEDAQRLLNSCYDVLANVLDGHAQNVAELLSDNLTEPLNHQELKAVYSRSVNFFNTTTNNIYTDFYRTIYRANTLLDNFDLIDGLSESERARMEAEARFVRGLSHWWVMKIWSQPWGYSPDNSHLSIVIRDVPSQTPIPRSPMSEAFEFILQDFTFAYQNLPEANGVYADKYAAAAMLTHAYFQKNDFSSAASFASEIINSGNYALLEGIDYYQAMGDSAFQFADNPETIFAIHSTQTSQVVDFRNEGFRDFYRPGAAGAQLSLSNDLQNLLATNASDNRLDEWTEVTGGQNRLLRFGLNSNKTYLFSIPLLRLSLVKLIRAESLAETGGDLATAIADVNDIRERAFGGTANNLSGSATAQQVIAAAREEFRKETIGEGLRIDQIRRIGAKGENIEVRGAPWNCPGMAIQFPNSEFTGADFIGNPEGGCQ